MFDKRKDGSRGVEPPLQSAATAQPEPRAAQRAEPAAKQLAASVIGPGLAISGNLSGTMDVVIGGQFEGVIDLPENHVRIADGSRVHANVKASTVEIEGQMTGDVEGMDKVVLSTSGRMEGNILAPRVILVDGAKFKGSIDMSPAEPLAGQPAAKRAAGQTAQKPATGEQRPQPTEIKKATA